MMRRIALSILLLAGLLGACTPTPAAAPPAPSPAVAVQVEPTASPAPSETPLSPPTEPLVPTETQPAPPAPSETATPMAAQPAGPAVSADDPTPPVEMVKLVFIHHSTGYNWLSNKDGKLGQALRDNNYFVSDTFYEWGPDHIGDTTDIGNWWTWFRSEQSPVYWQALLGEFGQIGHFARRDDPDPARPNQVVLFKSCYPNSRMGGSPNDPPNDGDNPLIGQEAGTKYQTVANAKGIYKGLLEFFAAHPDTLFVAITAPPLIEASTTPEQAANARAFNNWLVYEWLADYPYANVAVFDFYNVLTSNAGSPDTNDLEAETGNHHRWWQGSVQHVQGVENNYSSYPTEDSHPSQAGNLKATAEFVPLLNVFYHRWQAQLP